MRPGRGRAACLTGLFILLSALFSWRVYKSNIPYGRL